MENYIRDVIFEGKEDLYFELDKLSENIKKIVLKKRPFLIEFTGTCRSGKSTSIELISDVLIKNGLKVLVVDEEYVGVTKDINHNRDKKMTTNSLDYTNNVIEEKISIYDETIKEYYDIIIYDRGINDEFVWLDIFDASIDEIDRYDKRLSNRGMDLLVIMTCSVESSLKRKYLNSLSVLPSKWTNKETLEKYLFGLDRAEDYFDAHSKEIYKIETDEKDKILVALDIANEIVKKLNNSR